MGKFIYNILVLACAALAIVGHLLFPFVDWNVNVKLSGLAGLMDTSESSEVTTDTEEESPDMMSMMVEALAESDAVVTINIQLKPFSVMEYAFNNDPAKVDAAIDGYIGVFVDAINEVMPDVAAAVATPMIKNALASTISGGSDFDSLGVSEETMNAAVEGIVDAICEGGTKEEVTEAIMGNLDNIVASLPAESGITWDTATQEQVSQTISEYLEVLADDEGNVSLDVASLLALLGGSEETPKARAKLAQDIRKFAEGEEDASNEEIKAYLIGIIGEETFNSIVNAIKTYMPFVAYFLIAVIAIWALLAFDVLFRMFFGKRKCVTWPLQTGLGSIHWWILWLVPFVVNIVLTNFTSLSSQVTMLQPFEKYNFFTISGGNIFGIANLPYAYSSSIYSFAAGLLLFLIGIFGYNRLRRREKQDL